MPIAYILNNLLAEVSGAAGVVFLDEVGEAIETASASLSLEEMRTIGAIAEIQLRRLQDLTGEGREAGGVLHVEGEGMHLHAVRLKDGFVVVLLQGRPSLSGVARNALCRAGEALEREILT